MNKKYIILLSLMITVETFLCATIVLTGREVEVLNDIESISRAEDTILTISLPLIGEVDLYKCIDSHKPNICFVSKKVTSLDLSPTPILLEDIRVTQNGSDLEFQAKAQIFGRDAQVSLGAVKRASDITVIQNPRRTKMFLDISEMTLVFNFGELAIKLLERHDLNFNSASIVLRKNKPHQFLVTSTLLDQSVDFYFTFLPDQTTLIKYFIINDTALSKLFSSSEFNGDDITLKNLSLTNEYKSESLFSKSSNFKIRGNSFADVQIIDENLPIRLIDLPTILDYHEEKYALALKLPEFSLPVLGIISNGYLKATKLLKLSGRGILKLPQIGNHNYELDALYKHEKFLLRGKFDHSIKYDNFVIESPKFVFNRDTKSIKIFGKSTIYDIKCLVDLTFKNIDSFEQMEPELRIKILQKSWKPFNNTSNPNLSNIELRSPRVIVASTNGRKEVVLVGKTKLLNDEVDAQINFIKNAKGLISVLKVSPSKSCWKISDSFGQTNKFDDLEFIEPQFMIADTPFFDPNTHMYFNRGINFKGKLLLNTPIKLVNNLITLTDGDVPVSGSVSDDLKHFILQAPLAPGLSTKSKILNIGPMHLELNSDAPLSIISTVSVHPTETEFLNFTGNFKLVGNKLVFEAISPTIWNNMFSMPGFDMINPKLHMTLDNDHFGANRMPDTIVLEGDINFGKNKMYARSIMNEDFSKFSLAGHWDHFWLNELAESAISNKQTYSILPPLEIKNITFNISPDNGLQLEGTLGIFGLDLNVHGSANGSGLKIDGVLPKMVAPGIEIVGSDLHCGPKLLLEASGDKNLSKLIGKIKVGTLIEIHDPIAISTQGCSFESNTTLGLQKFGVKIIGNSLGFVKIPQFDLDIIFKNEAIMSFRKAITTELASLDKKLKAEINTVIADLKLLEGNVSSLVDAEQNRIANWALDENKRKLAKWVNSGLVKLENNEHTYYSLTKRINLREVKFHGPAQAIVGSAIPLTYILSIFGEKREVQFMTDFSNLEQTIKELAQEIIEYRLNYMY